MRLARLAALSVGDTRMPKLGWAAPGVCWTGEAILR